MKLAKKVSPYEKVKRQKIRTRQKMKNEVGMLNGVFKAHFEERRQERAPNMTDKKLSKDFCGAITGKRIKRCRIGKVYKVYGNKFRYILGESFELITLYPVDKKKENESNKQHDWVEIDNHSEIRDFFSI